jgi:predicted ArsR family transcriptional regulator
MSLDEKARALETVVSSPSGVRDVVRVLTCRTSRAISLLEDMEKEKLIEFHRVRRPRRGRPKKTIICTSLGSELLDDHR